MAEGKIIKAESCRSCKFARVMSPATSPRLICRRLPPHVQAHVLGVTNEGPKFHYTSTQAPVEHDDWCGEYARQIVLATAEDMGKIGSLGHKAS